MAFSTQTSREAMRRVLANPLLRHAKASIEEATPKQIALSGPAGFLGSRVLSSILDAHDYRRAVGLEPGEVVLLSSSPGNLMSRLINKHGHARMASVRATRVDYYFQHDLDSWRDQLGSLGMGGSDAVFVNLAALAGPRADRPDAMMAVNYRAPLAAARACEALGFGHWIQSSTQAVKAERAGQVPYSRWKAMADYSLARLERLVRDFSSMPAMIDFAWFSRPSFVFDRSSSALFPSFTIAACVVVTCW